LKDIQITKDPEGRIKKKKIVHVNSNYEGVLNIIAIVLISILLAIAVDHIKKMRKIDPNYGPMCL
jgi:hypothetical protein